MTYLSCVRVYLETMKARQPLTLNLARYPAAVEAQAFFVHPPLGKVGHGAALYAKAFGYFSTASAAQEKAMSATRRTT